jgi:hypothetical protein
MMAPFEVRRVGAPAAGAAAGAPGVAAGAQASTRLIRNVNEIALVDTRQPNWRGGDGGALVERDLQWAVRTWSDNNYKKSHPLGQNPFSPKPCDFMAPSDAPKSAG